MRSFSSFKEAIDYRINESEENYWIEDFWKEEIKLFTADISKTINFIKTECTDEELYWLSEVFGEIADKTQSRKFIQALRDRLATVCSENYHQPEFRSEHMRKYADYNKYVDSLSYEIEWAEGYID